MVLTISLTHQSPCDNAAAAPPDSSQPAQHDDLTKLEPAIPAGSDDTSHHVRLPRPTSARWNASYRWDQRT
jgi:hypothetical protein